MSFERHWTGNYGLTTIYQKSDSACQGLEIDMIRLAPGESCTLYEDAKEFALTILGGTCTVTGDGMNFAHIGSRKNVFDGKATALYVPRKRHFTITAETELDICAAKCPADADFAPKLITPDDVVVKNLGKPGFEREAHFLIDQRTDACKIYVGENFIKGGQWSSYPGHKHDVENMPAEGFAEEIYFYRYDKPTGFGIQKVYTGDRSIDETYTTKENDFVEIPKGYHPCTVAPGYNGYLLWMMCCEHRGFFMSTDPDHAWMNK